MKSRLFFQYFRSLFHPDPLDRGVLDFLYHPRIREALTQNVESRLVGSGQIITLLPKNEIRSRISELAGFADARVTLIDAAGIVVADSDVEERDMDNHLHRSELQEARLKGQGRAVRYSRSLEAYMLYVALPVKKGGDIVGYVRLARPLEDIRQTLEKAYRYIYLALLLVTLPCSFWLFLRPAITLPIRRLSTFIQRLRSGEPPGPLILDVPEEIDQLSRGMTTLLQDQQEKMREAQDEAERLRAAFTAMTEGGLILDGGGRILVCNVALRRMLGRTGETLEGKTLLEALRSAPLQEALDRFRRTGASGIGEIVLGEDPRLSLPSTWRISLERA
jgi:two-component system phosphate regulon sensor histidine kinase PhoR